MYAHCRSVHWRGAAKYGSFVVTVTVCPDEETSLIHRYAAPVSGEYWHVSMLNSTAAPSSGVPSWNEMPSRMVNVHSVPSALDSNDSTRFGAISPSADAVNSGSETDVIMT